MGLYFTLLTLMIVIILSRTSLVSTKTEAQSIVNSPRLLDLYIRDYTFKSFDDRFKTGRLQNIKLPANFSGIKVEVAKFRCDSLRRYGANVSEFRLDVGVSIHPCVERVMLVTQNLGYNWSFIYYSNYDLNGYQLVSPILGLLAYNAGFKGHSSNSFELSILAEEKKSITIDFSNSKWAIQDSNVKPLCASFESGGKVSLAKEVKPYICIAKRHGHFGLVIEDRKSHLVHDLTLKKESKWKVAVGSSIGACLGASLLGFLLVAMFVRVKTRSRMEELERTYQEEALQVSMVGHVRAPTSSVDRALPRM